MAHYQDLIDRYKQNRPQNVHGNSHDTDKPAELYTLRDNDDHSIQKIGETIHGDDRYTKKYLKEENVYRKVEVIGNKGEMHRAQHLWILLFTRKNGARPRLNNSDY